jgi:iron complex outermembrane receptor protein
MAHGSEKARWLACIAASMLMPLAAIAQAPPDAASPEISADEPVAEAAAPEEPSVPMAEEVAPAVPEPEALEPPEKPAFGGIEEIVVTTQHREQRLQDVPISAMGFSELEIQQSRITDVADLSDYTPNLEIKTGFAASNPTLFIRGIGLNDFNANAASSVAIYQDEVYMNSPAGQLFQLFDVEQVEVLRGPQGALYGRNATAGAIRVFSRKPDGDFSAHVRGTYGNFNAREIEAAFGFPILQDTLSGRVAFTLTKRDGTTFNRCADNPNAADPYSGDIADQCSRYRQDAPTRPPRPPNPVLPIPDGLPKWVNDVDKWATRGLLRWTPTDTTDWLLNVHAGRNRGDARQNQMRGTFPPIWDGIGEIQRYPYRDADRDPFAGDYDLVEDENLELFGASLKGTWERERYLIESITGYESNERSILDNSDATSLVHIHSDLSDSAWQVSQELRLASQLGGRFEWDTGAYFLTERLEADNTYDRGRPFLNRQIFDQTLYTWAAFLHGSLELSEEVSMEAGIRYNWEQKTFDIQAFSFNPNGSGAEAINERTTETWTAPTGDLILRWKPWTDFTAYAKYTRGFKGGHFNGGAVVAAQLVEPVEPEGVHAYELGLKSSWFGNRLQVNAAAFYYDYENYQVFALQNQPNALPLPQLLNAQEARTRGVEIEVDAAPDERLFVRLALGLLDAHFGTFLVTRSFRGSGCGTTRCPNVFLAEDFSGNPLVAAPDLSFTGSADYAIPLGRYGTLTPRVETSYKSKVYFDQQADDAVAQDPFWLFNARLGYRTPDERIEVAGWVRNITDRVYLIDSFDLKSFFTEYLDVYGEPRTFGVTVSLSY